MKLSSIPWATLVIVVQALVVLVVGAIVCVRGGITFEQFIQALGVSTAGVGLLSIGRGLHSSAEAKIGNLPKSAP